MASSEDAYGVFSFERQDEPVGIGRDRSSGEDCFGSGKESILSASMRKVRGQILTGNDRDGPGHGKFDPGFGPGAQIGWPCSGEGTRVGR